MSLDIICYHYVRPLARSRYPAIKGLELTQFRQQIRDLKARYHFVTMEELIAARQTSEDLPKNAAMLTFDDGYAEHFNHVLPVLHDAKLQGSFFIPKCVLLDRVILDVNKIHFILASCPDVGALIDYIDGEVESQAQHRLLTLSEYKAQHMKPNRWDTADVMYVKRMLQHALPRDMRARLCDVLFTRYVSVDQGAFAEELYLTLDQAKMMLSCGMHIGSHGNLHDWYDRLTAEEQETDARESLQIFEALNLKAHGFSFAYPYGASNQSAMDVLEKLGCGIAFIGEARSASLKDHRLSLPRWDTNHVYKHLIQDKGIGDTA